MAFQRLLGVLEDLYSGAFYRIASPEATVFYESLGSKAFEGRPVCFYELHSPITESGMLPSHQATQGDDDIDRLNPYEGDHDASQIRRGAGCA